VVGNEPTIPKNKFATLIKVEDNEPIIPKNKKVTYEPI
jgi:hypothetical protein